MIRVARSSANEFVADMAEAHVTCACLSFAGPTPMSSKSARGRTLRSNVSGTRFASSLEPASAGVRRHVARPCFSADV
eukprot:CAMPEP_0176233802 /NCGR_PEP_ID=MMETSP0121_2-20121125/26009_1 /TAXON_ID=160619 /ORGANISM="Kryptoperidinium foliaceum, Strain CCMP 1326" /LENGTH=77 /DNA_ID=CAMNT_0017573201 /DNA_START=1 /DNA_END=234 /DNA_ORIENTATION=-